MPGSVNGSIRYFGMMDRKPQQTQKVLRAFTSKVQLQTGKVRKEFMVVLEVREWVVCEAQAKRDLEEYKARPWWKRMFSNDPRFYRMPQPYMLRVEEHCLRGPYNELRMAHEHERLLRARIAPTAWAERAREYIRKKEWDFSDE